MKPLLTDGTNRKKYTFRFKPNGTSDPSTTYQVGGKEVASIAYSATGIWLVTLLNRHLKLIKIDGSILYPTDPGAQSGVNVYGVVEGMSATNLFYVAAYIGGSKNSTAATGYEITIDLETEESSA